MSNSGEHEIKGAELLWATALDGRLARGRISDRRALATLLEALALWHQAPVRAVVSAADLATWFSHGLVDELWDSVDSVHYTVEVRYPDEDGRQRIAGLDSFRDLRQLELGVVR